MYCTIQEYCTCSQDIVVGIGMIRGLNLSRTKICTPGVHPASYSMRTAFFFPEIKRPKSEADHSRSSDEVEEWRNTYTPPICLHTGVGTNFPSL